jgi:hypothetical protein
MRIMIRNQSLSVIVDFLAMNEFGSKHHLHQQQQQQLTSSAADSSCR